MRFNNGDETDAQAARASLKAGKTLGKKALNSKAGKAATKATGVAAKKAVLWIAGTVGAPVTLTIIGIIVIIFTIPAIGALLGIGMDSQNAITAQSMLNSGIKQEQLDNFAKVEQESEKELDKRAEQLSKGAFWDDMKNFFSIGKWGTTQKNFKTELANAEMFDENGKETLVGYTSSFNKVVAIINQSFIASLQDSKVLKWAKEESDRMIEQDKQLYINKALDALPFRSEDGARLYPSTDVVHYSFVDGGTAKVTLEGVLDPKIYEGTYLNEACFLIAASSVKDIEQQNSNQSTKNVLDLTFDVTGINGINKNTPIIWETVLQEPEYTGEFKEVSRRYEDVPIYGQVKRYFLNGNEVSKAAYDREKNNPNTKYVLSTATSHGVVGHTTHTYITMEYRRHGDIYYGAEIVPDFEDIVIHKLGLKTQEDCSGDVPDSNEITYEAWQLIEVQNEQLLKLYGESRNLTETNLEDLVFTGDVPFRNKELQLKIVEIALHKPPAPQSGYCLKWTNDVYQRAFGRTNRTKSALAALKNPTFAPHEGYKGIEVGAMLYGSSDKIDPNGGHVAIYIGDGKVVHNFGGAIKENTLEDWSTQFGKTIRWGWQGMENML